jgi:hypothetical protein
MNDQDFDFQAPQEPKDPKAQVSPALLAALGVTFVLAGGYYFWNSSGSTATAEAPAPTSVAAPAKVPSNATAAVPKTPPTPETAPPDVASASKAPAQASPETAVAPIPIRATPVVALGSKTLIPSSNTQFLTNEAIKIAGRDDPFKSAVARIPAPPSIPAPPKSPLGPPPPLVVPTPKTAAISPEIPPAPVSSTVPLKGIFQVQQDAYVVVGHTGGDEILRAGDYLDNPEQVQVVRISPSSRTVTFREKGKDIVRNVEANP